MANMVYESTYGSGRTPFQPDLGRGEWASSRDFVYTCLGLAFKLDIFLAPHIFASGLGVVAVLPHLVLLALFVVPVLMLQLFIGQFSSTGFISAFRIAPIFKGIGYVSLVVNVFALSFYSIFAAIPLLYFLNSFFSTLPWSCEGFTTWYNVSDISPNNICSTNLSAHEATNSNEISMTYHKIGVPSVIWFYSFFSEDDMLDDLHTEFKLSWVLICCNSMVWAIIALVFYKCFDTTKIAKFVRYALWFIFVVLISCLLRFTFLPGALNALKDFFMPTFDYHALYQLEIMPLQSLSSFGCCWGSLICLSSFNNFRTNIVRASWLIAIGQVAIYILFGLTSNLLEAHFEIYVHRNEEKMELDYVNNQWNLYLSSASAISTMELPNLWSIMYYAMLTTAIIILMVIQIYTILVSVFDDFVNLRGYKPQIIFGCIGILALQSIYFCSTHGVLHFSAFSMDALFVQIILYLLLLLIVLWIYGRERFQRDFEFMLGPHGAYATWKVNVLRFVSPLLLLILLLLTIGTSAYMHLFTSELMKVFCVVVTSGVWLFLPAYGIYIMLQTTGTIMERFRRSCRPTDWYPLNAEERQRYEEVMGNMDITHQLKEVVDDIL